MMKTARLSIVCIATFVLVSAVFADDDGLDLITAVKSGDINTVRLSLDRGAAVDGVDQLGVTALCHAVRRGELAIVQLLLERGADAGFRIGDGGITPLMIAVIGGDLEICRLLVRAGADPNAANRKGMAALLYAVRDGRYEIAEFLLANGADSGIADSDGGTPLMMSILNGDARLTKHLLAQHAPVAGRSKRKGATALILAVMLGQVDIVPALLAAGADVNVADNVGMTPLAYAAVNGNLNAIQLLLERGADVNIADHNGMSPLMYCLAEGYLAVATALLDARADVNIATTETGLTPMILAARVTGSHEVTERIAAEVSNVDEPDLVARTPLMHAAWAGCEQNVRILLERGADQSRTDREGRTARDYAEDQNQTTVLTYLTDLEKPLGE